MHLDINPLVASKLRKTINFKNWDVFFGDENGNILGTTPDGIKFKSLSCTDIHLGKMEFSDGTKARENMLSVVLTDPKEWNDNPALIPVQSLTAGFNINTLDGVYDVNMTASNPSIAGFSLKVILDGFADTHPTGQFTGLVKADFVLTKLPSTVINNSGVTLTDNGDGTYAFAATLAAGDYTVALVAAGSISTSDFPIEALAVATFTVPA
jgi:hypothetical protein